MNKVARPKHNSVLRLRIPQAEKHKLEISAGALGISTSGLVRMAIKMQVAILASHA